MCEASQAPCQHQYVADVVVRQSEGRSECS